MKHVDLEDCYLFNALNYHWLAIPSTPLTPFYFGFLVLFPPGTDAAYYTDAFGVN